MNLMTLVRLLVVVVVGWTVVSVGAGVLGVAIHSAPEPTFFLPRPALVDALPLNTFDAVGRGCYGLLDQTNGRVESLTLPADETWSLLSVSPWRNKDGNLEAAGRWVSRGTDEEAFCGIGFLTLHGQAMKKRATLDVLPTGKPCWVSARTGEILFPAGDGQLYRCNVSEQTRVAAVDRPQKGSPAKDENEVKAHRVTWNAEVPGAGVVVVTDPAVLPERGLHRLVFVALGVQDWRNGHRVNLPTKLWWLAMDDDGGTIVKAGRLTVPCSMTSDDDRVFERFPNVVARPDGKISLVYLRRSVPDSSWQLRSSTLEIDPQTSLPRVMPGEEPIILAKDLFPDPLIISAKGDAVYAVNRARQVVEHSIPR